MKIAFNAIFAATARPTKQIRRKEKYHEYTTDHVFVKSHLVLERFRDILILDDRCRHMAAKIDKAQALGIQEH